ncbi:F0F1 ATP synthase subunit B [Albibacterium bauzanense]|uniref:ATP synthase subunit b n=1 Tax=Albibacterium bauzanense TaxID=653929 RepID=A0A4R1LW97_9SPHI|nr:F0F1 ATP synthase subunit B [Albibacterium bauzanense]TCK83405.1 ATP synthase F0 subcomplex B subunit [Albibacterium bauzanense]
MELVTPAIGLIFWQTIGFVILLFVLTKFAWKPVMKSISERERSIEAALDSAEKAKEEMARLTNENEHLLIQARAERDTILKEAKQLKDQIVSSAKAAAETEGAKMIEKARQEIEHQKVLALAEVKNEVSTLALDIARKVLHKNFQEQSNQEQLVNELLKDIKLN